MVTKTTTIPLQNYPHHHHHHFLRLKQWLQWEGQNWMLLFHLCCWLFFFHKTRQRITLQKQMACVCGYTWIYRNMLQPLWGKGLSYFTLPPQIEWGWTQGEKSCGGLLGLDLFGFVRVPTSCQWALWFLRWSFPSVGEPGRTEGCGWAIKSLLLHHSFFFKHVECIWWTLCFQKFIFHIKDGAGHACNADMIDMCHRCEYQQGH